MRLLAFPPRRSESGAALVIVLTVLVGLSLLGLVTLQSSDSELTIAGNKARRTQAFLAAEAGLARSDFVFRQNSQQLSADTLLLLINADTVLPNAYFKVSMDSGLPLRRVVALGFSGPGRAGIQVTYRYGANPRNIWSNALFAGHGRRGLSIKGKVGIRGSVHILGDGEPYTDSNGNGRWDAGEPYTDSNHDGVYDPPLAPDSIALDMTGATVVSNHYGGMPAAFVSRVPPLPLTTYGSETVAAVGAELRVRNGNVALAGAAKIGQPNVTGGSPAVKETVNGVYVNHGFSGGSPSSAVHSDNGWDNPYDLTEAVPTIPNLDLPYTDPGSGVNYPSYMAYLRAHALIIPGNLNLKSGTPVPLQASGNGSITMDGAGNLVASGLIYVEGELQIQSGGAIQYDGRFTLVSPGNMLIDADFLSKGPFATDDVAGFITPRRLTFGSNSTTVSAMGAFFAQEEIRGSKKAQVAGSVVSNYFGATEIPDIFQVPALVDNLPPSMPGARDVPVSTWRLVPRSWVELN